MNVFLKIVLLFLIILAPLAGCKSVGSQGAGSGNSVNGGGENNRPQGRWHLNRTEGHLTVTGPASAETYQAYFNIPIAYEDQVPLLVKVESPQLVDYRFLRLDPPNVIVSARMRSAESTQIDWTAWVLIKKNRLNAGNIPEDLPIPTADQFSVETRKWLASTGCVQVDDPLVQEKAGEVLGSHTRLRDLTRDIAAYCREQIPGQLSHEPRSFSAVYALKWGNSCTGHAHAGAALLRANHVPARCLLNISGTIPGIQDHHWIVDYYVPGYGWVLMETTQGMDFREASGQVITMVCYPGHEFPLFYPYGVEGQWYTSDPALGHFAPNWSRAHVNDSIIMLKAEENQIQQAHQLLLTVYRHYMEKWNMAGTAEQRNHIDRAVQLQAQALENIENENLDQFTTNLQAALEAYEQVTLSPLEVVYFTDFELGDAGWSHDGAGDEWEWGTPAYGPIQAYSGSRCWGMDLDDTYENNADCWLLSPPIDLRALTSAALDVRIRNWVEDKMFAFAVDPLWMEISIDGGKTFRPLTNHMGGVWDDPEIPDTGGWNKLTLDLSPYAGHEVRVRFRFTSNGENTQPGPYIDDIKIYGRK